MAQTGARTGPYRGFNFRVEIDKSTVASFSEVSGLTADIATVDYREGDSKANSVAKLPALCSFGVIMLKRGYTKDTALWDWYSAVATGAANARRNGSIVLRDETQTDVIAFNFSGAILKSIKVSEFKAAGNEVAIESAELVVESLTIKPAK
jgi:phage tail-like protein